MSWVPVVDLCADPEAVCSAVAEACQRVGFLTVMNHGVAPHVLAGAWSEARAFFDLPLPRKLEVAMPYLGYPYGYAPMGTETLSASLGQPSLGQPSLPDLKESFSIGPVDPALHPFSDPDEASAWLPNRWPAMQPSMQPAWERAYRELSQLSARLLSMMARSLGLDTQYFDPMINRHTSAMRALNYPVTDSATSAGGQRAGAHTDYGTLTLLMADPDVGGLEVQRPNGEWAPVVAVPGALVVNLGDAMARWTNDRWRSTLHRVGQAGGRRQSIAFFHNANWDATIECLPGCLTPGEQPRYPPMAAGPHLMAKFRSTVEPG